MKYNYTEIVFRVEWMLTRYFSVFQWRQKVKLAKTSCCYFWISSRRFNRMTTTVWLRWNKSFSSKILNFSPSSEHELTYSHTTDFPTGLHFIDFSADWRLVWNTNYLQEQLVDGTLQQITYPLHKLSHWWKILGAMYQRTNAAGGIIPVCMVSGLTGSDSVVSVWTETTAQIAPYFIVCPIQSG